MTGKQLIKIVENSIRGCGCLSVILLAVGFGFAFSGNQQTGGAIAIAGAVLGLLFMAVGVLFWLVDNRK